MKKILALILAFSMIFCVSCKKKEPASVADGELSKDTAEVVYNETEDESIILYYPDKNAISLVGDKRQASEAEAKDPEFVIKQLILGTQNPKLENVIPSSTAINSCQVSDGVCIVDVSRDFIEIQGSAAQEMAIYSVVNTLCNLDGIDSVKFLVEGERYPLFGNYDFSSPFEPDWSFVHK